MPARVLVAPLRYCRPYLTGIHVAIVITAVTILPDIVREAKTCIGALCRCWLHSRWRGG